MIISQNKFLNFINNILFGDNQAIPSYIIFLAMFYMTTNLMCDPLVFRQLVLDPILIEHHLKLSCSAFVYPIDCITIDAIIFLTNRRIASIVILFGILCDGVFSLGLHYVASLPFPHTLSNSTMLNTVSVNAIGHAIWPLWYHGLLANLVVSILEIAVFSAVFRRSNNFLFSAAISTFITLSTHIIINDYPVLNQESNVWEIIISNSLMTSSIMLTYIGIMYLITKVIGKLKPSMITKNIQNFY